MLTDCAKFQKRPHDFLEVLVGIMDFLPQNKIGSIVVICEEKINSLLLLKKIVDCLL